MGDLQVFLHATLIAFEPRGASLGYRVPDCFGMRVTSSGHALPATGMLFPKMDMGTVGTRCRREIEGFESQKRPRCGRYLVTRAVFLCAVRDAAPVPAQLPVRFFQSSH